MKPDDSMPIALASEKGRSFARTLIAPLPTGLGHALVRLRSLATLLLLAWLLALAQPAAIQAAALKAGDTLPSLATFKLEGKLPDGLQGKVVMLDFWASWCDPCKASFPVMNELQTAYGDKGLVVLAVNVDEKRADMEAFLKKHQAEFVVVRDGAQKLVARAGIATMPSSFLVDRTGKVRFVHSGFRGEETTKKYKSEIETLLKEGGAP